MSMIRYASTLKLPIRIHLIFSCRNQSDIPFFEELSTLEQQNPFLRVTYVISEGEIDHLLGFEVIQGRVNTSIMQSLGYGYAGHTYMICGPSGYIRVMQSLLVRQGVPVSSIFSESFSQGSGNSESMIVRWPMNTYALAGVSFLMAGIFVISNDFEQTIPNIELQYESTVSQSTGTEIQGISNDYLANIQAIPPQ